MVNQTRGTGKQKQLLLLRPNTFAVIVIIFAFLYNGGDTDSHHQSCCILNGSDAFSATLPSHQQLNPRFFSSTSFTEKILLRRQSIDNNDDGVGAASTPPTILGVHHNKEKSKSTIIKSAILKSIRTVNERTTNDTGAECLNGITTNYNNDDFYGPVEIVAYSLFRSLRRLQSPISTTFDEETLTLTPRQQQGSPPAHELSGYCLGMKGRPFVLQRSELEPAFSPFDTTSFAHFFTMQDLQQAVEDDFLDAARGSTDPRSGWKITDVSVPRGESFEEARMTYTDVCNALEKGTVIFNAAGAHIPKLASICLAACDATALPCALNMYITASGKRTSAPPHTDKQDVFVIQTQGRKLWKVYSIPDPSIKPNSDIFARGKGEDNLPLHTVKETSEVLLETILYPGDILFIPAGFPHTTSTIVAASDRSDDDVDRNDNSNQIDETSVHLTLGIDHHVWELNYLSVIRLAYRRAGRTNSPIWDDINDELRNPFIGNINLLPINILEEVMTELPLGLLDATGTSMIDSIVGKAASLIAAIDPDCVMDQRILRDSVDRIRQQGVELLDIHREMYISAIHEGRTRKAENDMTAHLNDNKNDKSKTMSSDRIQRLSLFRVKRYYDQINESKERLKICSMSGTTLMNSDKSTIETNDGATSSTISVGDKVEAELGGAFFPATVTRISDDSTYDVTFFDGDKEVGLTQSQIRLLLIPQQSLPSVDTSKMTTKQLKRWKREQEKSINIR